MYAGMDDAADEHNPFSYKNFLNRYGSSRDGLPPAPAPGRGGVVNGQGNFRGPHPQQGRMQLPPNPLPNRGIVPPVPLQHQEHSVRRIGANGGQNANGGKIHDVHDIFADSGDGDSGEDDYTHNPPFVHPEWLNGSGHQEKGDDSWLHPSMGNGSTSSGSGQPNNNLTSGFFSSDISSPAGFDNLGGHLAADHMQVRRNSSDRALQNRLAGGDTSAVVEGLSGAEFVGATGNSRLDDRMYINKLRKDIAFYKRKLEEVESYADQTSQELQRCQAELDAMRVRERNETEAMEKVMAHVEANLQSTTRRALDAETALGAMIEENRALKEHIAELTAENEALRIRSSNDVRKLPSFERAQNLARFLQASCQSANMMLHDMLDGVEQIHLASVALESLGTIEELPSTSQSQSAPDNLNKQQQLSSTNKNEF